MTTDEILHLDNDEFRTYCEGLSSNDLTNFYKAISGKKKVKADGRVDIHRLILRYRRGYLTEEAKKLGKKPEPKTEEEKFNIVQELEAKTSLDVETVTSTPQESYQPNLPAPPACPACQGTRFLANGTKCPVCKGSGIRGVIAVSQKMVNPNRKQVQKNFDDNRIIRLKTKVNPKRAGSASFDRFELYVDGMTVGEALKAGVSSLDIRYDSDPSRRYIVIEE